MKLLEKIKKANCLLNKVCAIDAKIKKEFQSYVKEIYDNLKKNNSEVEKMDLKDKKDFDKLAYIITGIIQSFNPSNANHSRNKKYFPRKYDETLVSNADENTYDSEWYKMTDNQQWTIVKKGLGL